MAFSSASNYNIEKKYGQDFTPKLNAESGVVFAIGCIKCNCVTIQMKYLGGNFMSSVCFFVVGGFSALPTPNESWESFFFGANS